MQPNRYLCGPFGLAVVILASIGPRHEAHANGFAVLHGFAGGSDGASPFATLTANGTGRFFGTTEGGGNNNCFQGCGTVFKMASDGSEAVLYAFGGRSDGYHPIGSLIADGAGNLYGTTYEGGAYTYGTVFRVTPDGAETIIHAFSGEDLGQGDGVYPVAGLIFDASGNLYGTTTIGGEFSYGTIFRIAPDGSESVLYSFKGNAAQDGAYPEGRLLINRKGDLFGTTLSGGSAKGCDDKGCGTVFRLAADGREKPLYVFSGGSDGANPGASLVKDKSGNLFGAAENGGTGDGVVFKLANDGTETVLYAFKGGSDGSFPGSDLVFSGSDLLGTTNLGGGTGLWRRCRRTALF